MRWMTRTPQRGSGGVDDQDTTEGGVVRWSFILHPNVIPQQIFTEGFMTRETNLLACLQWPWPVES